MKFNIIILILLSISLKAQTDQKDEEKTFPTLNSGIIYSQSSEELLKEAFNHFDGKRFELCLDYLQQAVKVNKNSELSDILYYYQSLTFLKLKKTTESLYAIDQAINLNSNKNNYYNLRVELLIQLGEFNRAEGDISIILSKDPQNEWALLYKGILQHKRGLLKEALKSYNFLINKNASNPDAYFYRGMLLLEAGVADRGCEDLNKAESLGNPEAKNLKTQYCR
jgi:tetratricopeptide (TPR) repeat protein